MKTDKTDNEVIAEFVGGVKKIVGKDPATGHGYKEGTVLWYGLFDEPGPVTHLEFDNDWMWLMSVVQKINKLHDSKFEYDVDKIAKGDWPADNEYMEVIALPLATPIDEAYKAVIKFIKWLNETVERETKNAETGEAV